MLWLFMNDWWTKPAWRLPSLLLHVLEQFTILGRMQNTMAMSSFGF